MFILFNSCYFLGIIWFIAIELHKDGFIESKSGDQYATGKIISKGDDTFEIEYMDFCNKDFPDSADANENPITFLH